jgi:hypothetical protein
MAIHDPVDAFLKRRGPEVDQEPQRELQKSQVCQHLFGVNRRKLLD